jgi:hypothetical protein
MEKGGAGRIRAVGAVASSHSLFSAARTNGILNAKSAHEEVRMSSVKAPPGPATNPQERVLMALRNPHWDWRTVSGLAAEAGFSESEVLEVLHSLGSAIERGKTTDHHDVYRLRRPGEPGEPSSSALFWSYLTKSSSSST